MTDNPLQKALAVLDDYMAGLNRGDEVAVNAACNFPHVRLAGGKVVVWQTRGEYRLDDFRARAGDGWARSRWDERTPIHVGPDKVHLKVKFSRHDLPCDVVQRCQLTGAQVRFREQTRFVQRSRRQRADV